MRVQRMPLRDSCLQGLASVFSKCVWVRAFVFVGCVVFNPRTTALGVFCRSQQRSRKDGLTQKPEAEPCSLCQLLRAPMLLRWFTFISSSSIRRFLLHLFMSQVNSDFFFLIWKNVNQLPYQTSSYNLDYIFMFTDLFIKGNWINKWRTLDVL